MSSHFRRLKLGADAVDVARPSSTNSGAGVDKCCERQQRKRFIGYGNFSPSHFQIIPYRVNVIESWILPALTRWFQVNLEQLRAMLTPVSGSDSMNPSVLHRDFELEFELLIRWHWFMFKDWTVSSCLWMKDSVDRCVLLRRRRSTDASSKTTCKLIEASILSRWSTIHPISVPVSIPISIPFSSVWWWSQSERTPLYRLNTKRVSSEDSFWIRHSCSCHCRRRRHRNRAEGRRAASRPAASWSVTWPWADRVKSPSLKIACARHNHRTASGSSTTSSILPTRPSKPSSTSEPAKDPVVPVLDPSFSPFYRVICITYIHDIYIIARRIDSVCLKFKSKVPNSKTASETGAALFLSSIRTGTLRQANISLLNFHMQLNKS